MNLLLLDTDQWGLDFARRAAGAGHTVRWWQKPEPGRKLRDGAGFGLSRVDNWRDQMTWAKGGLIVNLCNDKRLTAELDRFRSFGFPIYGPSLASANLEIQRAKGMEALKQLGVQVPDYESYDSLPAALKAAAKAQDRQVFKTLGDNEDKSLSYVSSGPEDMVWRIKSWMAKGLNVKGPCMLQEFVEGIEVGVSAWVGKGGFVSPWNVNFEHKKLMNEDYGPATGEMGTVCAYVDDSRLADMTLAPCESLLKQLGHIGDVDLNCIVDDKGVAWCLEWTTRFGFPSTPILMASHEGDPVQWMRESLTKDRGPEVSRETAIGVLMAAPPFPAKDEKGDAVGMRVEGIDADFTNVAPIGLERAAGELLTTNTVVCVPTALGPDVHDVQDAVYATAKQIRFPNRMVRTDIGARLEDELPKLHALGFDEMPRW